MEGAWSRRPATAVSRLSGRPLLLLSARDLLAAADAEGALLVALVAPAPAASAGFARAARDAGAPLILSRPSGAADEVGPEEARDDAAFVESALKSADELHFHGPLALLKEPPRAGSPVPEAERIRREIDAGFTGVALATTQQSSPAARDAALVASHVCQLELGLEIVPLGGSGEVAAELVRQLKSRGAPPSALRLADPDQELAAELEPVAISTTAEIGPEQLAGRGVRQLIAAGPFLRALERAAPRELLETLQGWADERGATLEQAAARHQRLFRELPPSEQEKLEALCCFEALELYARAGAARTAPGLLQRLGSLAQKE
ncbi:MAG TPA: hypothetical protein VKB92_05260 [Myxococcales bacterium]|nr:hypothetical protein [Myxococcales bacterium]